MKALYNILTLFVWIGIALILFPILVFMVQLVISLVFIIAELLVFPVCVFLVYLAYKSSKQKG